MIFEKFTVLKIDRTVKAMIGISRDNFDVLAPVFQSAYETIQTERIQRKEIKRLPSGGSLGVFDSNEKRLFFVLFYLKTYPTFDVLGFHFTLSAGHAHDYICQFMPVLKRALEIFDVAPKRAFENVYELKQSIEKYSENSEICIDGLEVPCVRPHDQGAQVDRYSGKKKRHTLKSLVISSTDRYIIYVSHLFGGHEHDYGMMNYEFDPQFPWFANTTVLADLGFLGADKDYWPIGCILLPHKKPRRSQKNPSPELTETQKKENRAHSRKRIFVEHAIGGMKHFHCLTHRIRNQSIAIIDQFFGLAAGLWNLRIYLKSMT